MINIIINHIQLFLLIFIYLSPFYIQQYLYKHIQKVNKMEQAEPAQMSYFLIHESYIPNPKAFLDIQAYIVRQCKGVHDNFVKWLKFLDQNTTSIINFTHFRKFARIIRKFVLHAKNPQIELAFSTFLLHQSSLYFPYHIKTHQQVQNFKLFIQLINGLKLTEPENLNNQPQVILYLECGKYNEEFFLKLLQKINQEVIVDRKSQNPKTLKLNQFFNSFLVRHIQKIIPQLQRLLVRSQSNIQIWQDTLANIVSIKGMEKSLDAIFKKVKNYFLNFPQASIGLMNSLGGALSTYESHKQYISFVSSLVSNEHNSKKKLNYLKMTEGLINSIRRFLEETKNEQQYNSLVNQLMLIYVNSYNKFSEDDQAAILIELLDKLLPLVKTPSDDIAKSLKIIMKSQNKNVLIYMVLTLSIYSADDIDSLPSVKQIFNYFKGQINVLQKKALATWQWFVPLVSFMAKSDPSLFDNLSEDLPIYKASCLSMFNVQKRLLLEMLTRYYKYMIAQQQDIPDHFWVTLALLLEEVKRKQQWELIIKTLTQQHRLQIISRGIYPLFWYPCKQLKKNKNNNQFTSLIIYILSTLVIKEKNKLPQLLNGYKVKQITKIVITCRLTHVKWNKIFKFQVQNENDLKQFEQIQNRLWKSALFDYDNEQELLVLNQHKEIIRAGAQQLLQINIPELFNQNIKQCLKPYNYQKNLEYIIGFESQVKKCLISSLKQLDQTKNMLFERNFSTEQKPKQRKVYFNPLFIDTRMMSQEQVKTEKYRKHFQKMLHYFENYVKLFMANIKDQKFLFNLWNKHFTSLIQITQYSQTRVAIFGLVRRSIQKTYSNISHANINDKQREPQQKIFLKYSTFFGEFFCIRHSKITPSLSLMEKSSGFLKAVLAISFNDVFADYIFNLKTQFIPYFINDMCEQILQNMEFDLVIKKLAIHFYYKAQQRLMFFDNYEIFYTYILKNINILSSSEHIKPVLIWIMKHVDKERYNELFEDILSYVADTKILILQVINELMLQHQVTYQPGFQEYIKLRILALQTNRQQISPLANQIIKKQSSQNKDILKFNLKNFMQKNSKQTVQKLCLFIKQEMKPEKVEPIFKMFCKTFNELFDQNLDQEGLQIFPYFVLLNLQIVKPTLFYSIFELLVMKFTSNQNYVTLNRLSMEVGIEIIKYYSVKDIKYAEQILKVLESFINRATGVSNIVFLGVLAPFLEGNKNLVMIQKRITQLFKGQKEVQQKSIAKCMPDLMSFFKQPKKLVQKIYLDINGLPQSNQLGQAYLAVGLLKGIGHRQTMQYLQRLVSEQYITKTKSQKSARIYLLTAFVEIFGKFIQIKANRVVEIVIIYMADNIEEIRNISKRVVQTLILKMSSYAVKKLLPHLLNGLENQSNWRVKISYIWILGIMANCSARQLQTSLPIIVPTLSACLSNAHPNIRNKASQALNLIGQTIKNPEISNSIDILIEALQNPFQKSDKALDILLKTRFSHFIDAPSLSIIVPITDYCLRGRNTDFKAGACQVIGSIVELIMNPYDLLPYLRIIGAGLKAALCDPLSEIRAIAAMAVGKISSKIGKKNAQQYFQFILDIIQSPTSNTTQRQGAAQAYSQIICSHDYDYFEESLNKIFDKLNEVKHSQKQGFILVFLYVPNIKREQFEGFIKEVNKNMYAFVADEDQNIRNSAMQVQKVLINHYCLTHTDLLLEPLCQGVFQTNWRKRNGALILLGELLNILKSHMYNTRTQDKAYAYYKGLMAVYILKDDQLQMPRLTANQVWNAYIQNTPKTIRTGLRQLVGMWARYTHEANGVVFKNIGQFSSKYGQNYFQQILGFMEQYMPNPLLQKGIFEVLNEFIKRLQAVFMSKQIYKTKVRQFFTNWIFKADGDVRTALSRCLAVWVQKMKEQCFFEQIIYPQIQKMDQQNQTTQQYTQCLHLMRDLLHTSSQKIVDRLINKIMQIPLSQFKIQIITNNADRLSNQLYTQFKQPATEIFVQEIYTLVDNNQKQNRLELIIYCLEQVSLKLNLKYKIEFVRMMTLHLRKTIQKTQYTSRDQKIMKKFLGIIFFFLSSIQIGQIQQLQILLGDITPLMFVKQLQINQSVHKIFQILIANPKQKRTPQYLKQMIVSMENNAKSRNITVIWEEKEIATNYITILVKCIAYGNSETMEEALEMTRFLMKYTKRQIIDKEILKIVGPIIRVINYPLLMKQKILLMDFLSSVYQKRFNIQVYSNQILSICFRLLQQFKTKQEVMICVSNEFQNLLLHSTNKNDLMLVIINKIKIYGNVLVEAVYYLVKSLLNQGVQLPKVTYQKIYEQFNHICIHNEMKLPLRGIYYASKTAARLAAYLGIHIEKLSTQLKAITCPYEVVLNYLHFSYYAKLKVPKLECIQIFIKQSSRQKVYYLLKSLKLCNKVNAQTKNQYTLKYMTSLVPQGLSGFDDIIDVMEEFEDAE